MRVVRSIAELRTALRPARRDERQIGLVPTMGALHDGHLSLIRRARDECDEVVVSLFVNPTQFNEPSDLDAYPRDEAADAVAASETGADILFAPAVEAIYPDGFATEVRLSGPLVETLEGAHRGAEHFHGVTTVVTKLLNIVQPAVAYFGQKDAQQGVIIKKLVSDLDMPVRIEIAETMREPDGLAMSSRNVRLDAAERERALALKSALDAAAAAHAEGVSDAAAVASRAREAMTPFDVEPEYLALVDPNTLAPVAAIDGEVLVAIAARVGETRLIDNTILNGRQ
jgi:pantoate--beta-alanine ligase